jgi:23S rRNA (cytosine1962-C5)-methyltransferase
LTQFAALRHLPRPADQRIALHVTPAAEKSLRAGHPWLYESSVIKQNHAGKPGDLAVIYDKKNRFLAVGLYDPTSPIRVKVLQAGKPAILNQEWFYTRLAEAADIREPLLSTQTNGYRLIHGENDGLPGLIIDRYAATWVIKIYTAAWLPHLQAVLAALVELEAPERIVLRLNRQLQSETTTLRDGQIVYGEPLSQPIIFQENGLKFAADVVHGHKTGFFFDQRDNRQLVGQHAAGKNVLDVFAYSGGFSVYAAAGGAKSVFSLDVSAPALAAAQQNMALNKHRPEIARATHDIFAADAFEGMARLHQERRRFEMVIVDPPSFAKSSAEFDKALAAYARLVKLALPLVHKNGILVMASCSSHVSSEAFFRIITETAQQQGRPLHDMTYTGHALDHPIGFPEGAYLKCVFAHV